MTQGSLGLGLSPKHLHFQKACSHSKTWALEPRKVSIHPSIQQTLTLCRQTPGTLLGTGHTRHSLCLQELTFRPSVTVLWSIQKLHGAWLRGPSATTQI